MKKLCTLMLFTAAIGCGPDDDDKAPGVEVADQTLSGEFAGEPFEFRSGWAADIFGDGEYWIELGPAESDDPCASRTSSDRKLLFQVPPEPMDERLSFNNNVTFSYGEGQNDIAVSGRLIIERFDDRVVGGLNASTTDHQVNGTFDIPVCEEAPF